MNLDTEERLGRQLVEVALVLAREIVHLRGAPGRPKGIKGKKGIVRADVWFRLTLALQSVPGALAAFEDDPEVIWPAVAQFVRFLYEHPPPGYDDVDLSDGSIGDHFLTVVDNWGRIRVPGGDTLICAFRQAEKASVVLLDRRLSAYGKRNRKFRTFVSVAYWLQQHQGAKPITLPQKRLAGLFDYADHTPVSKFTSLAMRVRLLTKVTDALSPRDARERGEKPRAAEYRFDLNSGLYKPPAVANGHDDDTLVEHAAGLFGARPAPEGAP